MIAVPIQRPFFCSNYLFPTFQTYYAHSCQWKNNGQQKGPSSSIYRFLLAYTYFHDSPWCSAASMTIGSSVSPFARPEMHNIVPSPKQVTPYHSIHEESGGPSMPCSALLSGSVPPAHLCQLLSPAATWFRHSSVQLCRVSLCSCTGLQRQTRCYYTTITLNLTGY